jgi:hypothetical protein
MSQSTVNPAAPQGDGVIHPNRREDEIAGGADPIEIMRQYLDRLMSQDIENKRRDFEKADAALDVEIILDLTAAVMAAGRIGLTWAPYFMGPSVEPALEQIAANAEVLNSLLTEIPNAAAILAEKVQENASSALLPDAGEILNNGIDGILLYMAAKTYAATKAERQLSYEDFVDARARQKVARDDNGIYAPELLFIYAVEYGFNPEEGGADLLKMLRQEYPHLRRKTIKPEFLKLLDEAKDYYREKDNIEFAQAPSRDKGLQKKKRNFKKGITDTRDLLFKTPIQTGRDLGRATINSWRLRMPHKLGGYREDFKDVAGQPTWIEQKERVRSFHASMAVLTSMTDPQAGAKEKNDILGVPFSEIWDQELLGQREAQSEQTRTIRDNVSAHYTAETGFRYTGIFMALNAYAAWSAFSSASMQGLNSAFNNAAFETVPAAMSSASNIGMAATVASLPFLSGALSAGITFVNVSPLHSIAQGLNKLEESFQKYGKEILQYRRDIRKLQVYQKLAMREQRRREQQETELPLATNDNPLSVTTAASGSFGHSAGGGDMTSGTVRITTGPVRAPMFDA